MDFSVPRSPARALKAPASPRCPRALAGAIAGIALERLREGRAGDPAAVDANYVRRSDAELLWKDR